MLFRSIPFKPSGDRRVYCQDCFSRRKVINLSGIKVEDISKEVVSPQASILNEMNIQVPQVKVKKKIVTTKKPVAKKKLITKTSKKK